MARVSTFVLLSLLAFTLLNESTAAPRKKMVKFYELKKGDFSLRVSNWGAIITSVVLPDSKGNLDDVVLGYDGIRQYINDSTYFGALVGRVANRIGGAHFVLYDTPHSLYQNDGNNTLHGGHRGFNQVFWTVKKKVDGENPSITFYYHSFDGEQGFPGDLDVHVTYKISGDYELSVIMEAKALNKATPVNLAQHSYWNLGGHGSGTILDNSVQIFGSHITPVDSELIPTGEITPVSGTPYDFTKPNTVGSRIDKLSGGYDINYVLDSPYGRDRLRKVAVVEDPKSGRRLELSANQPGLQFYSGNFLNNEKGKGGHVYPQHAALALETQGFPDSVNHPAFPSQIVNPGETYKHHMQYKFSFA